MHFWKMNGAGNDFIVVDNRDGRVPSDKWPEIVPVLCERHMSIGADGFMVVEKPTYGGDYKMLFFNSDGSVGEMCGNGARCICRFGHDIGLAGDVMTVETDAGLVPGWRLDENLYRVKLNNPYVLDLHRKGDVAYLELGHPGVPHAVAEYKGDLWADADKLLETFRALRFDPAFPKGANVNFYQLLGMGRSAF